MILTEITEIVNLTEKNLLCRKTSLPFSWGLTFYDNNMKILKNETGAMVYRMSGEVFSIAFHLRLDDLLCHLGADGHLMIFCQLDAEE